MSYNLDIIIPVFNEQGNILKTLSEIIKTVDIKYRIVVIYDYDEDPTLKIINENFKEGEVFLIKNKYFGFNGAVKTGFENLDAEAIMLYPADEHINFNLII